ncbi:MAG: hypothetical protein JKY48_02200 [Flavobacteriales bacterium]|nr:hypothetical protein [Flavobacteriales bacterium]
MNVKQLIIAFILFSFATASFGQAREDKRRPSATKTKKKFDGFKLEDVVIGGNFGAQFGSTTLINLSPNVGYKFSENWLLGVSATYIYYREEFIRLSTPRTTFSINTNIYGGGPFTQYYFLENFIAHLQYEYLNREAFTNVGIKIDRVGFNSVLIGGGYRSAIGANSFANILLLYNLNETADSPYRNPILRISFGFGL